ncbi:MAG: penicillin-binding protein 1C, partial [Nonlabens sp.]|nr:penicillin-binding protein 1C [Nonlabens sp.]
DCTPATTRIMQFIRPKHNPTITTTRDITGAQNDAIFELAHQNPEKKVFWYIDSEFLGETRTFHEKTIAGKKGKRLITAVDEDGNTAKIYVVFE